MIGKPPELRRRCMNEIEVPTRLLVAPLGVRIRSWQAQGKKMTNGNSLEFHTFIDTHLVLFDLE